jgi:hypothetical protein
MLFRNCNLIDKYIFYLLHLVKPLSYPSRKSILNQGLKKTKNKERSFSFVLFI